MSKKQHKNQFYKRELNKFTQELEVLLKDPVIRKQYDTDIETKEHFSIHKRDGSYRFSCIQVVNSRLIPFDEKEVVYIRSSHSLKEKLRRLITMINIYKNLDKGDFNQTVIYYLRYKSGEKQKFEDSIMKYLFESESEYLKSIESDESDTITQY